MKVLNLLFATSLVLALSSCSTWSSHPEQTQQTQKDPIKVSVYNKGVAPTKYKVLGKTQVSKFNVVGIKRQEAIIHDALRNAAANMGGDAVIDLKYDEKTVYGTVVALDKQLIA